MAATLANAHRRRVAVFCRVIDNVGDAGVCWRLARQLALEHHCEVTLFVDRIDVMRPLWPAGAEPATDSPALWQVDGVSVRDWPHNELRLPPDTLLLCTFGCELPLGLRAQIATDYATVTAAPGASMPPPRWINVEHLSAEGWVETAHRQPSIKPSDGAREYYFFPGFSSATGGLLRESDLASRQAALADSRAREASLHRLGAPAFDDSSLPVTISLFSYGVEVVGELLEQLSLHPSPVRLLVPEGVASAPIARFFGRALRRGDATLSRGALHATALPWLDQRLYDELLFACDLNFVRGEDSWIRAHWAGRPFVWQPYPQEASTRRLKLDAWLDHLTAGWPAAGAAATRALHYAWSNDSPQDSAPVDHGHAADGHHAAALPARRAGAPMAPRFADAWPAFAEWALSPLGATRWQVFKMSLRRQRDLATQLIEFTQTPAAS